MGTGIRAETLCHALWKRQMLKCRGYDCSARERNSDTQPSRTHSVTQTEYAKSYSLMARSDMEGRTCMHKHMQSGSASVKAWD